MLVSVALYISGNSACIAATAPSSTLLAAVTSAQASLPTSGPAAGSASNLAGNAATAGFPGLIIAVVVGCIFIFYLAHRRKP
jgi:hypothetical protein